MTSENYDLKNTVTIQDKKIKSLNVKISELEADSGRVVELENQINKLSSSNESEIASLKSEVNNLRSKVEGLTSKNEEISKFLSEKETKLADITNALEEKEKIIEEQKTKLEKAETELTALKPAETSTYTSEDRLICPECGAVGKDIKTEEDKSKVLGYIGHSPMYGKIHACKRCGRQF
ncbi:MAG: hypothetical protein ACFFE4_19335 [Candidatus Thorarchaeota archaeon]